MYKRQEQYKPTLYIKPVANTSEYEAALQEQFKKIQQQHPGVELKKINDGWQVVIPEKYKEGHEAHFGMVFKQFLNYLQNNNMPAWEVPNMLAKYYTTTQALTMAQQAQSHTK